MNMRIPSRKRLSLLDRAVAGRLISAGLIAIVLSACGAGFAGAAPSPAKASPQPGWQADFNLEGRKLSDVGEANYFVLKPGFQLVLKSASTILQVTVLNETRVFRGTTTRVVEEREAVNGQLAEIARNYYAIDPDTGDAFYFGEDVNYYKDGNVSGHAGAWLAYENGNKPGMIMPGMPKVGLKYYQELAPGVAMDRAEITSVTDTYKTPAGEFSNIVVTRESSQIEPAIERKTYAPGIGLVQDGEMKLVSYGYASAQPSKLGQMPDRLTAMEAQAEDIMDVVPQADWPAVQTDINAIETAWKSYQAQAKRDGVAPASVARMESVVAALKSAATAKDSKAALQAANDVSAGLVEMMALYDAAVPPEIGWLDVLERQVILDTTRNDEAAAKNNLVGIHARWNQVKPAVLKHGGQKEAEQFEQSLEKQARAMDANNSAALAGEARVALEIVDALEKVFLR